MKADLKLHRRLLEVCYKNDVHHLGSHFSSIDIIDNIYSRMSKDDIFHFIKWTCCSRFICCY